MPTFAAPPDGQGFGSWLSARMTECGWDSDLALANIIGISDSTISRWRRGLAGPRLEELRKLAEPLDTALLELAVRAGHLTPDELGIDPADFAVAPTLHVIVESGLNEATKQALLADWRRSVQQVHARYERIVRVLEDPEAAIGSAAPAEVTTVLMDLIEFGRDLPELRPLIKTAIQRYMDDAFADPSRPRPDVE